MNFDLMNRTFGGDRARVLAEVASLYIFNPNTFAVTVGISNLTEPDADIDVFVYSAEPASAPSDSRLIEARAGSLSLGLIHRNFNDGTERWIAPSLGAHVDIVRRCPLWFSYAINKIVRYQQVQAGSSTCLLHELAKSKPIYDRAGWFAGLRDSTLYGYGYPGSLKVAILHKNYPLLNIGKNSWLNKAELAYHKGDTLAVFKYCSCFLASYFDILFALNEEFHPGEKQLMEHAMMLLHRPPDLQSLVRSFLMSQHGDISNISFVAHALIKSLDPLFDIEQKSDLSK